MRLQIIGLRATAGRLLVTAATVATMGLLASGCGDDTTSTDTDTSTGDAGSDTSGGDTVQTDAGSDTSAGDTAQGDSALSDVEGDTALPPVAMARPLIGGSWFDGNITARISDDQWVRGAEVAEIVEVDNDGAYLLIDAGASSFGKITWANLTSGGFDACTIIMGAATLEEARDASVTLDPADPATGCDGGPWAHHRQDAIELQGRWESAFGSEFINGTHWMGYANDRLETYDNVANFAVTEGADGTFSKIVWTETADGFFHYCTVAFGEASARDAEHTDKVADDTDPDTSGCGDFPWSRLSRVPFSLRGSWASAFGDEWIHDTFWQGYLDFDLVFYDDNGTAITRSQSGITYDRIVYTRADDLSVFYCTTSFDNATLEDALADDTAPDATAPELGGCGDFPWSHITPVAFELTGTWSSAFGDEHVHGTLWDNYFTQDVIRYDADAQRAIVRGTADDSLSVIDYRGDAASETFRYCTVAWGLNTVRDALRNTDSADDSAPDSGGCGGFPWSRLDLVDVAITGQWSSAWGDENITQSTWTNFGDQQISWYDAATHLVVTRSGDDASYSKIVYKPVDVDSFYYCTTTWSQPSVRAALDDNTTADDTDPDNSGCGGFSWTKLTRK